MSTQLQMVNRVLRRLREDTVSTVTENDYSILIAEFLNEAMEEVTGAHDWSRYERTCYATLAASGNSADLSKTVGNGGAVEAGTVLTDQSKLIWTCHNIPTVLFTPVAYASAFTSNSDWERLSPATKQEMLIRKLRDADNYLQNDAMWFDLRSSSSDFDAPSIEVYPYVNQASTLLVQHWTPPSTFALDGTDDGTEIEAPESPIFRYTLMLALNERGEELGEPGNTAESRYVRALERAIEDDLGMSQRNDEFDWRRD